MIFQRRSISSITAGLLGVACVLYIVANAVPLWSILDINSKTTEDELSKIPDIELALQENVKSLKITYGLWMVCASINSMSECVSWPSGELPSAYSAKIQSARGFITLACILSGFASICALACAFATDDLIQRLIKVAKVLPFTALIGGIIGVAVGITFAIEQSLFRIGVASILAIVALVFNLAGAIAAVIIQ